LKAGGTCLCPIRNLYALDAEKFPPRKSICLVDHSEGSDQRKTEIFAVAKRPQLKEGD
jgi:hypothetical protein